MTKRAARDVLTAQSRENFSPTHPGALSRSTKDMLGLWARVGDQGWHRPDQQGRLDSAMAGQIFFCPACGRDHDAPTSGSVDCQCGAKWVTSVGYNPLTGDVGVVRIERWK